MASMSEFKDQGTAFVAEFEKPLRKITGVAIVFIILFCICTIPAFLFAEVGAVFYLTLLLGFYVVIFVTINKFLKSFNDELLGDIRKIAENLNFCILNKQA